MYPTLLPSQLLYSIIPLINSVNSPSRPSLFPSPAVPDLGLGVGVLCLDRGAALGLPSPAHSTPEAPRVVPEDVDDEVEDVVEIDPCGCTALELSSQHCKSRTTSSAKLAAKTARSGCAARPVVGLGLRLIITISLSTNYDDYTAN